MKVILVLVLIFCEIQAKKKSEKKESRKRKGWVNTCSFYHNGNTFKILTFMYVQLQILANQIPQNKHILSYFT